MRDQYEELCAAIRSRGLLPKVNPMKRAIPPPVPGERRITAEQIAKAESEYRETKKAKAK